MLGRTGKVALFALCLGSVVVAGCYSPNVPSGGFACQASDDPPCPSGFFCVNGLCVDHPGPSVGPDLAMSSSMDDMTQVGGGDMTMTRDMAMSTADMSMPPASGDMAGCFSFGHGCGGAATCCAQCCAGGCTVFGYCAL